MIQEPKDKAKILNDRLTTLKSQKEIYQKWLRETEVEIEAIENSISQIETDERSKNYPFKEEV